MQHAECVPEAAANIFNSTCGVQVTPASCENVDTADGIIIAVISLVGDLEWSIFLGLPKPTATEAAAKFAGFAIPFESADMGDAVGELTNIFAGEVKAILNKRGVNVEISLPSVIRAQSIEVLVQRSSAAEKVCFDSPLGKFWTGVTSGKAPTLTVS